MSTIHAAQDLVSEAQSAYNAGDYLKAGAAFAAAEESYRLKTQDLLAAEMANNASVAFTQAGEYETALKCLSGVAEVFELAGDFRRQAMTLGNRAAALEGRKDTQAAIQAYTAAAALFRKIDADDLYADTMQALSALQLKSGLSYEAVATMKTGLSQIKKPGLKHKIIRKILDLPSQLLNR